MPVLTKEIVMMNYLFNFLYDIGNDNDFIERLKEELEDDEIRNTVNSANEKTRKLFEEPFQAEEIKARLKEANETFTRISEKSKADLLQKLELFENADFLKEYFSSEDNFFNLNIYDSGAYIEEYSDSVLRKIVFENPEVYLNGKVFNDKKVEIYYDTIQIIEENGSYILQLTEYFADMIYEIKFKNISVFLKAYSAQSDSLFWLFINTPWDYVVALAQNINEHFRYGVANQKEKKIFALIKHLVGEKFSDIDSVPADLYHLIEKHNLKNIIKPPYDLTEPYLCKKKFEPFWRDIFNLISESQKELPSYFEETVSPKDLEKHQKLITEQMNALGYSGTYPDYYKKDSINKPTLLKTYNLSHVVAFEKHVEHHIHCYSFKNNDVIHTAFFVGTIFNKSHDDKSDIYSTMFDCNGKAVFSILSTVNAGAMNADTYESWTKNAVKAAVKKADLKKADKDDYYFKSIFERNITINFKSLLLIFLLFSFGFSLIVPLLLIILEGSNLSEIIAFFKSEPIFLSVGIIGGLTATSLIALFDWISSKK